MCAQLSRLWSVLLEYSWRFCTCKYSWCFLCDCVTKVILQGYHLSENSATISMLNLLLYLKCCPIPSTCKFKMIDVISRVGLVLFWGTFTCEPTSLVYIYYSRLLHVCFGFSVIVCVSTVLRKKRVTFMNRSTGCKIIIVKNEAYTNLGYAANHV